MAKDISGLAGIEMLVMLTYPSGTVNLSRQTRNTEPKLPGFLFLQVSGYSQAKPPQSAAMPKRFR
jgi:hypothetical protein